jgi:twitching motility protein PilT
MIVTPAISNLIREGKTHMIYSAIETGMKFGMMTLDTHLAILVKERLVLFEEALSKAQNPEQLRMKLGPPGPGPTPPPTPGLRR